MIDDIIKKLELPNEFKETVTRWYLPLASDIARLVSSRRRSASATRSIVIGIQGCQGSGKSTLAEFLVHLLHAQHGLNSAVLSLDDFYLTREERIELSQNIHPLLVTRGVPGTHDVPLALGTINALKHLPEGGSHSVPRFDKSIDDRAEPSAWSTTQGPIDVIIFEGWCVGLEAQSESELAVSVNGLEAQEDGEGHWRQFANQKLASDYARLFRQIDALAVLKAPSFHCVFNWRLLQEQKLIAKLESEHANLAKTMSPAAIERFISHYQRLTEHAIRSLPAKANWLLTLGEDHTVMSLSRPQAL